MNDIICQLLFGIMFLIIGISIVIIIIGTIELLGLSLNPYAFIERSLQRRKDKIQKKKDLEWLIANKENILHSFRRISRCEREIFVSQKSPVDLKKEKK